MNETPGQGQHRPLSILAALLCVTTACSPSPDGPDVGPDGGSARDGGMETGLQPETSTGGDADGSTADGVDCETAENPPPACGRARPTSGEDVVCPSGEFAGGEHFDGPGVCMPESPTPPELSDWTCPDAWTASPAFADENGASAPPGEIGAFDVCVAPSLPDDCAAGTMPLPGRTDCVRQGTECPAGDADWPSEQTLRSQVSRFDGDIHYVAAGASGGSGTRASPYAEISTAVDAAGAGDIVAVGTGTYETSVELETSVALVGACAEATLLRGTGSPSAPPRGVVDVTASANVSVTNLGLTGERDGLTIRDTGGETVARHLAIRDTTGVGLHVSGSDLRARDVAVRGTQARGDESGGPGVVATSGAEVDLRRAALRDNAATGLRVAGNGTHVTLRDASVSATRRTSGLDGKGRGIVVRAGAELDVQKLVVRSNRDAGLQIRGTDSAASVETALIAEQAPNPSTKLAGEGIEVREGATFDGKRIVLRRNHDAGVFATGMGSTANLDRVLVDRTRPSPLPSPFGGNGLEVAGGAELTATNAVVHDNHSHGVIAKESGTASLTDAVVTGTDLPAEDVQLSRALKTSGGATLEAERLYVHDNRQYGLRAVDNESAVTLVDTVVAATTPMPSGSFGGIGISIAKGADLTARRLAVRDNHNMGLQAARPETDVELRDTVVAGTEPLPELGDIGFGILIGTGADLEAHRLHVDDTQKGGLLVGGAAESEAEAPTTATVVDGVVERVHGGTGDNPGATAAGIRLAHADFQGQRLLVRKNDGTGIGAYGSSTVGLEDTVILETNPRPSNAKFGYGLVVAGTGDEPLGVDARRFVARRNHSIGLVSFRNTTLTVRDALLADTRPQQSDEGFGDGIYLGAAASNRTFEFERTVARANHRAGALVSNRNGRFVESLMTGNRLGLVREGQTSIEVTDTPIRGNSKQNERCQQQCYEEPPEPAAVAP